MYSRLKHIIVYIVPSPLLYKFEFLLRKVISLFYTGSSVICVICNKKFSSFIDIHNDDKMCPRCGSLGRHRRLWQILNSEIAINHQDRILDLSPSRIIKNKLRKKYSNYISSDFEENRHVDKRYDITNIPEPGDSFRLIICYHILEHIENDSKAISELYRTLKHTGIAIIQTPFKDGETYENPNIRTPKERLVHFGQEDHVRIYSVSGLKERLEAVSFKVNILEYKENENNILGFKPLEQILLCTK